MEIRKSTIGFLVFVLALSLLALLVNVYFKVKAERESFQAQDEVLSINCVNLRGGERSSTQESISSPNSYTKTIPLNTIDNAYFIPTIGIYFKRGENRETIKTRLIDIYGTNVVDAINYLFNFTQNVPREPRQEDNSLFKEIDIQEDYIFLFRVTHNVRRDPNITSPQLIITRLDEPSGWDNITIDIKCYRNFPERSDFSNIWTQVNEKLLSIETLANSRTYRADTPLPPDTDTNPFNNYNSPGEPVSTAPPAESDLTALNKRPNQEINTTSPPDSSSLSTPSPVSTLFPDTDLYNSKLNKRPVTGTTFTPVNLVELPSSTTTPGGPSSTTTPGGGSPPPVAVTTTTSLSTKPTPNLGALTASHIDSIRRTLRDENTRMHQQLNSLRQQINSINQRNERVDTGISNNTQSLREQSQRIRANLNSLGDLQNNYSAELKSLLQKEINQSDPVFDVHQKVQESRIADLERQISEIERLRNRIRNRADNELRSIICRANGSKLNVQPIFSGRNPTGMFVIYVNDRCVSYREVDGTVELRESQCDLSDRALSFKLKTISNYEEYNNAIQYEEQYEKKLAMRNDDIFYPFYLVEPVNYEGKCLYIMDDNSLLIKTVEIDPHSRFRKSDVYSVGNCA